MCETLLLYRRSCQNNVKTFKTSNIIEDNTSEMPNKIIRMIDINLRSVVATTSAGGGLTSLRRLCTNLNFPQPITENSYNRYIRHVETNAIKTSDRSLSVWMVPGRSGMDSTPS